MNDMPIEAVVLTGGLSTRMGRDKADILVDGERSAHRIARLAADLGLSVTILGPRAVGDFPFQPDKDETHEGPLAALASFVPGSDTVIVLSCDLVRFHPAIVGLLVSKIREFDAVVPAIDGRWQPLCGAYRASAFEIAKHLVGSGERRLLCWLERLQVNVLDEAALIAAGVDPQSCRGANTLEELRDLGITD